MQKKFPQDLPYTIPYGCLIPKRIENLYLCGRNISGTHLAHSNFRVMHICANMGQSIGISASLCVKNKKQQKELIKKGINP